MDASELKYLLGEFDLGASTAEKDPLLESAKIDTPEFNDLFFHDRIDIIRGIKGAGKTALYRVFFLIQNMLIEKKNLYCIFGVEATGDPVFRLFKDDFEGYTDIEFENFWNVYFISLVYDLIFNHESLKNKFSEDEVKELDSLLAKIGLKFEKEKFSLRDIIYSILQAIKKCKKMALGVETKVDSANPQILSFKPTVEFEFTKLADVFKRPIYVSEFKDKFVRLLKQKNFKIWLMLDRLDEVFPHRSPLEKNGLRGLLKAAYNFSDPNLRVKIFLRDDIIEYLASDGFTALTHVTDRASSTMAWSKDSILHLIVKRLCANNSLKVRYAIDANQIDVDKEYREKIFYMIFPLTIGRALTIEWLYVNCADSNKVVTPRDIIDFFRFAKNAQFEKVILDPQPQKFLITADIFKLSLEELSRHKKTTFLFAEFPHLRDEILAFSGGYAEHNADSLQGMFGTNWRSIVEKLFSIGFIAHIPKAGTYKIPRIWRAGLNIRRGKAFKK